MFTMLYCTRVELTLADFRGLTRTTAHKASTTKPFSFSRLNFPPAFPSSRGRNRRIITTTTHHSDHPCFVGKYYSKRYNNHCGAEGDGAVVCDRSEFKRRWWLLWWDWVRKSYKRELAMFLVCSGVVTTLLFGRFETIPYSNRTQFLIFKADWEKKLGEWGSNYEKTEGQFKEKILPDIHPATVRARKIGDNIFRALKKRVSLDDQEGNPKVKLRGSYLNGLNWQIIVVDEPSVNACCLPGGYIVVFKGLLDRFKSNAEIASVICHEVGHAVARHHAESITNEMWFRMLQLTFLLLVDFARVSVLLISELCRLILLDLPASRSMELEADYIGLLLVASAGYDPRVVPRVIDRENKLSNLDGSSEELPEWLEYISSHPFNKKRAEILGRAHVMDEAFSIYRDVKGRRGVREFLEDMISSFPFF